MLERFFRFQANGTSLGRDTVAGLTTFLVMSCVIFVNPAILSFSGDPRLEGKGLPYVAALTSTCLVAGVMTLVMALSTNRACARLHRVWIMRMLSEREKLDLRDLTFGLPATMTIVIMPLTYSVANGIGAGFITCVAVMVGKGEWRKVHPLVWMFSAMCAVYFVTPLLKQWSGV